MCQVIVYSKFSKRLLTLIIYYKSPCNRLSLITFVIQYTGIYFVLLGFFNFTQYITIGIPHWFLPYPKSLNL